MATAKRKSTTAPKGVGAGKAPVARPVTSPEELAKREHAFHVYCNLGPARSYRKLQIAIMDRIGAVATRTLTSWATQHSWQERVALYDAEQAKRASQQITVVPAGFDREEALLEAASQALVRALNAQVAAANPHQLKALIDCGRPQSPAHR